MANYPLAPYDRCPTQVYSVLRALKWLKRTRNVSKLVLAGDSAGGNLATFVAALLEVPTMLPYRIDPEDIPEIIGVISLYGILDRHSWTQHTPQLSYFENVLSRFALRLLFFAYTGDQDFANDNSSSRGHPFNKCVTLCDLIPLISKFPPTLLIVGRLDVLVHSSRLAHQLLTDRNFQSELLEYDSRHAFIGLPPDLNFQHTYFNHAKPATEEIVRFLDHLYNTKIKR